MSLSRGNSAGELRLQGRPWDGLSGFLNVFEQQWDGSPEPAHSYYQLDLYVRRFRWEAELSRSTTAVRHWAGCGHEKQMLRQYFSISEWGLLVALKFSLEGFPIMDDDLSPFYPNQVLRLEPTEIARDELSDGSNLCRQFLIGSRERNFHALWGVVSVPRHAKQKRNETVSNSAEWKLLDDADESSQAPSYNSQDLQAHFRMLQAEWLEIFLADEEQRSVSDRGGRGWVSSSVKYGELRHGTAWTLDRQHLLTSAQWTLEDSDPPCFDDPQAGARISLREDDLACTEVAQDDPFSNVREFLIDKVSK
jgi:hypothetical protein